MKYQATYHYEGMVYAVHVYDLESNKSTAIRQAICEQEGFSISTSYRRGLSIWDVKSQ